MPKEVERFNTFSPKIKGLLYFFWIGFIIAVYAVLAGIAALSKSILTGLFPTSFLVRLIYSSEEVNVVFIVVVVSVIAFSVFFWIVLVALLGSIDILFSKVTTVKKGGCNLVFTNQSLFNSLIKQDWVTNDDTIIPTANVLRVFTTFNIDYNVIVIIVLIVISFILPISIQFTIPKLIELIYSLFFKKKIVVEDKDNIKRVCGIINTMEETKFLDSMEDFISQHNEELQSDGELNN